MKINILFISALLFLCTTITAGNRHKNHNAIISKNLMAQDTLIIAGMEIVDTGISKDTVVTIGMQTIPIYRVLVQDRGRGLSARDWAAIKTNKMKKQLNLTNRQSDKLYKVNLMEAKETESYRAEKNAMKMGHIKKMSKAEKKFTNSLTPIQLLAYNQWQSKEQGQRLSVKSCRLKGKGKKMIVKYNAESMQEPNM